MTDATDATCVKRGRPLGSPPQESHRRARARVRSAKAALRGGVGVVSTSTRLVRKASHIEVVVSGTTVQPTAAPDERAAAAGGGDAAQWSVGCSGTALHCLRDSGFEPRAVVWGNEAYSRGLKGFLQQALAKTLLSGEVTHRERPRLGRRLGRMTPSWFFPTAPRK